MFAVACTWPISERIWEFIDNKNFPFEIIQTQVHYTEHLYFHKPIQPDDTLSIKGHIACIMPHRAGTVIVMRFDAFDNLSQPVFTEHIGGLFRGVQCVDEGKGKNDIPQQLSPHSIAEPLWERSIVIDRMRPYIYDGCTNIHFPIHTSKAFAKMVGLPDILLQGTATLAYAAREIVNHEIAGNAHKLKELSCRFTGMMIPPGDIHIVMLSRKKENKNIHCFFEVNGNNGRIISNGYARIVD